MAVSTTIAGDPAVTSQNGAGDSLSANAPGPSTLSVHGGEARGKAYDSITTPIVQTSTYTFRDTAALVEYMEEHMFWEEPQRFEYGRYGNPTVRAVENKLAALEGGDDALLTPSGMSAITGTLLVFLSAGSHLVCTVDCYRRTRDFIQTILTRYGVEATVVPAADLEAIEAAIRPNTRLIFSESPTNPFMRCLDLEGLAEIGRKHRVRTAIDSTFATPLNLRPLDYGIDLVIHSVTKYLAGHNDVLAGVVVGNNGLTTPLRQMHGILGSVLDPQTAYLIGRGLKTLGLRVERQNANGLAVARFLEAHPRVRQVWYPGLPGHPDHAVASAQLEGVRRRGKLRGGRGRRGHQPLHRRAAHSLHRPQPGRRREPGGAGATDQLLRRRAGEAGGSGRNALAGAAGLRHRGCG